MKKIRTPTVHAKNRQGLTNIESLRFSYLHENMKYGWSCFVFLLNIIHGFKMDYDENWKIMCEGHGIPAVITKDDYLDYSLLCNELNAKHFAHLNDETTQ
ncbi:MAG: hypothetical protein HQL48_05645 [Gammaproteobacteria bacterium]|nr:hypothetical protein [Gammaproteobacteria bacterium]